MGKIKVLVLDDEKKRMKQYKAFAEINDFLLQFISLEDEDPLEKMNGILDGSNYPDIIILDHKFTNAKTKISKGTSLISAFRMTFKCPIIAVTAAKKDCIADFDSHYDDIFDINELSSIGDYIKIMIDGFYKVSKVSNMDELLKLLEIPETVITDLSNSLPDEIKNQDNYISTDFNSVVYKWFINYFYKLPGFLHNIDWTATLIGVNKKNFKEYEEKIEMTKYDGIWSNPNDKRWWKSKIYELISSKEVELHPWYFQEACNQVLEIKKDHISKCYKCQENWPEIMALTDYSDPSYEQVHLRCSQHNHRKYSYPYYEEPRIMI
jgi:hypothetical protein